VVIAGDGAPVPKATILPDIMTGPFRTDERGHFQLDGFCLDGKSIRAAAGGFAESAAAHIREPFPASLQLRLFREAGVGLTILDAGGEAIRSARFDWYQEAGLAGRPRIFSIGSYPDRQGKAEIRGARSGMLWILAYAPGFLPQVKDVTAVEGQHVGIELRLERAATVAVGGVVVGPDGRTPVADARVSLEQFMPLLDFLVADRKTAGRHGRAGFSGPFAGPIPFVTYEATTDAAGRFDLQAPAGQYSSVQVRAAGYVDRTSGELDIVGPTSSLRFQLFRGGRVQGVVRLPDGAPVRAGAQARLDLPVGGSMSVDVEADVSPETGRFVFERVRPGSGTLTVQASGYVATTKFEVGEGQVAEPELRFQSQAPALIAGRVVDRRDGKPLAMAIVSASCREGCAYANAITEDDGGFELPPLTAGKIIVTVSLPGYSEVSQTVDAAGGVEDLTIETSPGGRIEGEVTGAQPEGNMSPLWARLSGEGGRGGSAQVDEDGRFVLTHVAPGRRRTLSICSSMGTPLGASLMWL
jgi:hypothetical protein